MDKVRFYRAFHVALSAFCLLLRRVIFLVQHTAEYYEDQNPDGIRYSKILVSFQIFLFVQSCNALEAVISSFSSSQMELERIPDHDLLRLMGHFVSRFSTRNLNVVSALCSYMFFEELFHKDRDGVSRDGMPFLVVLIALFIYQLYLILKT